MNAQKKPTEVGTSNTERSTAKIQNIFEKVEEDTRKMEIELLGESERWKAHILDLSKPTKGVDFLFTIGGEKTIPTGELIAFKGKAKQGKSQLEYYLISAVIGAQLEGIQANRKGLKVFLFDTEQSQATLKKCAQRALKTAGANINKNHPQFIPFFLRPLTIEERKRTIEDAVAAEKPDIVFIDGIRDLLADFNDLGESADVISWLLRMCADYGCTIINVLHQNKAKEDTNMRGHLGTELLNKISDCFEVSKKDGRFGVTCSDSRNVPTPNFAFSINAEGIYVDENSPKKMAELEAIADIKKTLDLCFAHDEAFGYNDLKRKYAMESALGERTAKRHIKQAKDAGLLVVDGDKYKLNK